MLMRFGVPIAVLLALHVSPPSRAVAQSPAEGRANRLQAVRRFGYQLQKFQVAAAMQSAADMLVVDPDNDGQRLTPAQVAALQQRPGGQRRIVLAYLSIGEAEDYRSYWQATWRTNPPAWLGPENPDWPGNYKVRYWDPAWQALILGNPAAPLDRIVAEGYDGVYLDIVDGYEFWEDRGKDDARSLMVQWVATIANHARGSRSGFLVVPQNGAALAEEDGFLDQVDAIGREDLFFEGDKHQDSVAIADGQAELALFQDAGKPVFLIEYCRSRRNAATVYRRARAAGYKALVTVRALDRLVVSP